MQSRTPPCSPAGALSLVPFQSASQTCLVQNICPLGVGLVYQLFFSASLTVYLLQFMPSLGPYKSPNRFLCPSSSRSQLVLPTVPLHEMRVPSLSPWGCVIIQATSRALANFSFSWSSASEGSHLLQLSLMLRGMKQHICPSPSPSSALCKAPSHRTLKKQELTFSMSYLFPRPLPLHQYLLFPRSLLHQNLPES